MEELILTLDEKGIIQFISPIFTEDIQGKNVIGCHISEFVHAEDFQEIKEKICQTLSSEPYLETKARIRTSKSFEWLNINVKIMVLQNSTGAIGYLLAFRILPEERNIVDPSGNIIPVSGVAIDITGKTQQAIQESSSPITGKELVFRISKDGVVTDLHSPVFPFPESLKRKFLGNSIFSYFSAAKAIDVKTRIEQVFTRQMQDFKTTIHFNSRSIYELKIKALPDLISKNHVLAILQYKNLSLEIKKRLQKNERTLANLSTSEQIGIWQLNKMTGHMYISPGIEKISGYSSREFSKDSSLWQRLTFSKDINYVKAAIGNVKSGRILKLEYRIITKNKQIKWIRERVFPTVNSGGEIIFLEGIVNDITVEKDSVLPPDIEVYKLLLEKNKVGLATVDLNGKFTSVNEIAIEMTGYSENELLTMHFIDLLPLQEKETVYELFINILHFDGEIQNKVIKVVHKSGQLIHLNLIGVPIYSGGNSKGMYIVAKDISAKLELEEKLLKSKETFYEVYNQLHLAIFLTEQHKESGKFRIFEANQFACQLLEYDYAEITSMTFPDLIHSKNFGGKAFLENRTEYINKRINFLTKSGEKIPVSLFSHQTYWVGKRVFLTIAKVIKEEDISGHDESDPGRLLRVLMAEMDINTAELARETNLTPATISNLRTGKVKKPNIETASKIAEVLGVKISSIWPKLSY